MSIVLKTFFHTSSPTGGGGSGGKGNLVLVTLLAGAVALCLSSRSFSPSTFHLVHSTALSPAHCLLPKHSLIYCQLFKYLFNLNYMYIGFSLFFFWLHPKVPGQGSNPSCSCDLCHSYSNAGSLNHCTTAGTPGEFNLFFPNFLSFLYF